MRKLLLVLAAVLGGLLLLTGTAVAVVFGPDDTADAAASPLPAGVRAATTIPDLLGYRDATLRVTAESSDGPVFVGAGNPIDVDSYLGDTRRLRITTITPLDGAAGTVQGTTAPPSVAATSLDLWDPSVDGPGAQSLTLELDGTPTSVAVVAPGERGTVTLTFGIVVAHAFVAGVAAAVLGLALLALPILARRKRRRRERAAAQPDRTVTEPTAGLAAAGAPTTQGAGTRLRIARRPVRWAVPVACVVALTGCAPIPQRVTTAEITRPGLAPDELTAALASYDERNNAAIDLSSRTHDASGWAAADRGIILRSDLHQTRYRKEKGEPKVAGTPLTTTPEPSSLVSPSFTQYPMWFAVAGTMTRPDEKSSDEKKPDEKKSDEKKSDEKKSDEKTSDAKKKSDEKTSADDDAAGEPTRALLVYERDSVLDPWRMSASVPIGDETVPALAPGAASQPTAAQVARAQAVSEQVAAYLTSGAEGELTVPEELAHVREQMVDEGTVSRLLRVTVDPVGSGDDAAAPGDGAPKVAAADGGALMTATYSVDCIMAPNRSNSTLEFVDEAFARAVGQAGPQDTLHRRFVVAVAVVIPDSGEPTLLGVRRDTVGP